MNRPIDKKVELRRRGLQRQLAHWTLATQRLGLVDELAAPSSWDELERHSGVKLRKALTQAIDRLTGEVRRTAVTVERGDLEEAEKAVQRLRRAYLRTETTLDFFADAIATRANPRIGALLRAADTLARHSMERVLLPLGRSAPPVLTYVDKGIGASILKAGLRLWDGGVDNPVAAIKVVRHNLLRPTSLIHEAGHQVAHILDWNRELATMLADGLPGSLGQTVASWASEIAADAFAFVNAGYASVAALHDVVDGGRRQVFVYHQGDPHPISYVRVLLGVEMCRYSYGHGPWDDLASLWCTRYTLDSAPESSRGLIRALLPHLGHLATLTLEGPRRAFGGVPLTQRIDPRAVAPDALARLEVSAGPTLERSSHWLESESLRLVALTGYRFATSPRQAIQSQSHHLDWMLRLGRLHHAA